MVLLRCTECGIKAEGQEQLKVMRELSGKGCTFAMGSRGTQTWCACGARDSFERITDDKNPE